jgi:hypothetical protein
MTGSLDPTNNWVSATNVTGFSDWGITDQVGPTPLHSHRSPRNLGLTWEGGSGKSWD